MTAMSLLTQIIERHWQKPIFGLTLVLRPLSWLFGLGVKMRRAGYRLAYFKSECLPVSVVVVGNIHVGGSGKTPFVAALVKGLQNQGIKVGIVSRGYGRESRDIRLITPHDTAYDVGDEPLLLWQKTAIPVAVGADRVAAAKLLLDRHPETQVSVSDDGLQHYRMYRDMEIVLFSDQQTTPHLLPDGNLREPLERLNSVDILLTNNNNLSFRLPESVAVFHLKTHYQPFYLLNNPHKTVTADFFADKKVLAIAGIARPERFFNALKNMGISCETQALPDHAAIAVSDIPTSQTVIITEKDAVKLNQENLPQVYVLPIETEINPELIDKVMTKCRLK